MSNHFNLMFNPFVRIAGYKAFLIGAIFLLLTAIVGNSNHIYFIGIVSVKSIFGLQLHDALMLQAIAIGVAVPVFYLIGLLAAKGVRFQDMLGTVTLSRFPCLISAAFGFLVKKEHETQLMEMLLSGKIDFTATLGFWVFILIAISGSIWSIALLYKAFKISTGIKQSAKLTGLFIAGILLTECTAFVLTKSYFNL